jgi:hypothetical protein
VKTRLSDLLAEIRSARRDAIAECKLGLRFVACSSGPELLPHPPYNSTSNSALVACREADGTITRRTLVGPRCHNPLAEICRPDFSYAAWALTHGEVAPHPDLMKLWKTLLGVMLRVSGAKGVQFA